MEKKRLIERRPHYFHGQLLLEEDFLAEQEYHLKARHRHNLQLHGWGVVQGLEVIKHSETSVTVNPGFAIDSEGRELYVDQSVNLDLVKFGPNDWVKIALDYEEESESHEHKRRECYASLSACGPAEQNAGLTLAMVRLDAQAKIDSLSEENRKYARTLLGPGSVTVAALEGPLQRGWIRVPFRPMPIPEGDLPKGETDLPPFRVGATRAISPDHKDAGANDRGAGGTMAIPLPPSVRRLISFRLAGEDNAGKISFQLFLGGWNPASMAHVRQELLNQTIEKAPYLETYPIPEAQSHIDPEFHTLALTLRGSKRTSVSLIAVEVAYV